MPVTTRIIIAESGSSLKPHGMSKLPMVPLLSWSGSDEIHDATRTVCSRSSPGRPSSSQNAQSESAKRGAHGRAGHEPGGPLAEEADADEPVDGGPEGGQQRNQPDQVHTIYHRIRLISSMLTVSLLR